MFGIRLIYTGILILLNYQIFTLLSKWPPESLQYTLLLWTLCFLAPGTIALIISMGVNYGIKSYGADMVDCTIAELNKKKTE